MRRSLPSLTCALTATPGGHFAYHMFKGRAIDDKDNAIIYKKDTGKVFFSTQSEIQQHLYTFIVKSDANSQLSKTGMSSFSYNRNLLHTEIKKYLKIRRNICAIPTAERKRFISINKLCKCRDKRKIKKSL